jgi:hypothetical protein
LNTWLMGICDKADLTLPELLENDILHEALDAT